MDELVTELRAFRSSRNVSREMISRQIGTSVATLYRWEKGLSRPTGLCRLALQKYLKKNGVCN